MVKALNETYYDELMLNFGKPSRISHADGYIALDENGNTNFYYYLKDHLGNVRSVITPDANNKPVVTQANDYFPFGMSFESPIPHLSYKSTTTNKHKYNGKEEQPMPGKWLDYGARFYDAQIGRWHGVDPLAEAFYSFTPYHYVRNNPVKLFDPNGMADNEWFEKQREEDEKQAAQHDAAFNKLSNNAANGKTKLKKDEQKKVENEDGEDASGGGGGSGLPTIDGVTAPWSHEYITEKAFQILTDPRVGIAADLADWMRFTKGAGNTITLITVASDSYQRFYKQSIDNMTFGYRLTTTGLATWVGYSTGPIGGITVGLYSTGIEETAKAGAKLEIQMRNYFNPTTKGSFWSKFYW